MCYFCNLFCAFGPFSESVGEILQEVGRDFYSSIRPEEVFHVKILCLLDLFRNYHCFRTTPNTLSKQVSRVFWNNPKICRRNLPLSCVLVQLNLTFIILPITPRHLIIERGHALLWTLYLCSLTWTCLSYMCRCMIKFSELWPHLNERVTSWKMTSGWHSLDFF